jgi:lysozyme family protein
MALFEIAYSKTAGHEGGYSNDSTDAGKETYQGISRRYHPTWAGWIIIDKLKQESGFPDTVYSNKQLESRVSVFYKQHYWDVNLLDEVSSQLIADEMFDTGVNMGVQRAVKFLQRALNLLNKNGLIYNDIVEDGKMGPNTLKVLKHCLDYRGDEYLYKIMNILQGNHYLEYMNKSPKQEKFAYGWLNRVTFKKN